MEGSTLYTYLISFGPLVLIFIAFWLFLIRPQRKKDQKVQEMRSNAQPGDEIITIGGIVGKILTVKEDTIVIYCGADKTKMEFKKWAISEVTKKNDKPAAVKETKESEEAEAPQKKKIKKLVRKEESEENEAE